MQRSNRCVARLARALGIFLVGALFFLPGSLRAGATAQAPRLDKQAARDALALLLPTGAKTTDALIGKALVHIDLSLASGLWADDSQLTAAGGTVFDEEQKAVADLGAVKHPAPGIVSAIDSLVAVDRQLAQIAIDMADGGDPRELAASGREMDKAASELAKGHAGSAIDHYGEAWTHALKAGAGPRTFTLGSCDTTELIAAITAANSSAAADTIVLEAGCTYTLTERVPGDVWDNGLPQIVNPLTIHGNGATIEREASAPTFRLLGVGGTGFAAGGTFAVDHVNFVGGAASLGGAIFNRWQMGPDGPIAPAASIVVTDCTFTGNSTIWSGDIDPGGSGGAIAVEGGPMGLGASVTVTLERDTFTGNWTHSGRPYQGSDYDPRDMWDPRAGGAVVLSGVGDIHIVGSEFTGNWTGDGYDGELTDGGYLLTDGGRGGPGGAVAIEGWQSTVTIERSTFTGNHTGAGGHGYEGGADGPGGNGGAVWLGNGTVSGSTFDANSTSAGGLGGAIWGSATIVNSTFVDSSIAATEGGLWLTNDTLSASPVLQAGESAWMTAANTVFASSQCVAPNWPSGPNIAFASPGCTGTPLVLLDPVLQALTLNPPGTTATMALGAGSAALDAGDATVCAAAVEPRSIGAGGVDQRGVTRPQGAGCDMGAFELTQ